MQPDNGIHVDGFTGDSTDQELGRVRGVIQLTLHGEDVWKILRRTLKLRQRRGQLQNSYSDLTQPEAGFKHDVGLLDFTTDMRE